MNCVSKLQCRSVDTCKYTFHRTHELNNFSEVAKVFTKGNNIS